MLLYAQIMTIIKLSDPSIIISTERNFVLFTLFIQNGNGFRRIWIDRFIQNYLKLVLDLLHKRM